MALPLPSVIPNVGPGGNIVTSMRGINELTKGDLENKYYVPIQGANALSKLAYAQFAGPESITKFLSLPGIPQIIGPEKYNALVNQVRNSTSQPLANPFSQQQSQGGLLSNIVNKLTSMLGIGNNDSSGSNGLQQGVSFDQMPSQNESASSIPATGSFSNKPGSTYINPNTGEPRSIPTEKHTTALQNQLSASMRVVPQLQNLGKLWAPFMTVQGKAKEGFGRLKNIFGGNSELPSLYADAKTAAFTTVESYLKTIGVPVTVEVQAKLNDLIEPIFGESPDGYSRRIQNEVNRIHDDFVKQTQQQLSGGYPLTQNSGAQKGIDFETGSSSSSDNNTGGKTITLNGGLQVPAEFSSKEAFQDWYKAQPRQTQLAYAEYLKGNQ